MARAQGGAAAAAGGGARAPCTARHAPCTAYAQYRPFSMTGGMGLISVPSSCSILYLQAGRQAGRQEGGQGRG